MLSAAIHLIPYALVAALSPLGFTATITVMRTGRLKALGFALGVIGGQLIACAVLVAIGGAATPNRTKAYPTFTGLLELGLGLLLVVAAIVVAQRRPEREASSSDGRTQAALDRLQHVHALTAVVVGVLLGIGGPKRFVLTTLATASITATGITGKDQAILVGWYVLLATSLVWCPVLAYLLFGDWAVTRLDAALIWLSRHRRPATVGALAVIGAALLVDGVLLL